MNDGTKAVGEDGTDQATRRRRDVVLDSLAGAFLLVTLVWLLVKYGPGLVDYISK